MSHSLDIRIPVGSLVLSMLIGACWIGDHGFVPKPPDFVDRIDRPAGESLLQASSGEVTAEFFFVDDCASLIVTVPGHGEFVEESCEDYRSGLSTAECAAVENDLCTEPIPMFRVGNTIPEASSVCLTVHDAGHPPGELLEVRDGWWIAVATSIGGDIYPLDAEGKRLDSLQNEINDPVAKACGI